MEQTTLRKAVATDALCITRLVNSAYRGEHSKKGWTTEAGLLSGQRTDTAEILRLIAEEKESAILLCLNDGVIVGSVHIEKMSDHANLGMFVVEPTLQGHGIGKRLLTLAERTAQQEWGVGTMIMAVITVRHELIAFYERRGYRRTGILKPFPANPALWTPKVSNLSLELLEKTLT